MIEKLRRVLLQQNSILYKATYQVQYQWRGDDAVALFLIACQHILGRRDATAKVGEEDVNEECKLKAIISPLKRWSQQQKSKKAAFLNQKARMLATIRIVECSLQNVESRM
jgi:hypothetical protein